MIRVLCKGEGRMFYKSKWRIVYKNDDKKIL